jgi:hypothetical protein
MLTQLLRLLAEQHGGLGLAEISRELKAPPSAVAGMIDQLVCKGRLIEIGPDNNLCGACGSENHCNLLATFKKRYVLAPRTLALQEPGRIN